MATPRCPYCNTQGLKHLSAHNAGYYAVIYCNQCGAIYGVVPAPQQAPPQKKHTPQPAPPVKAAPKKRAPNVARALETPEMPFQHAALTPNDLIRVVSDFLGEDIQLTPNQLQHMYRDTLNDEPAPSCPDHLRRMVKITLPPGVKYAGQKLWVCPQYSQCRQWHMDKYSPLVQSDLIAPDIARAVADFTGQNMALSPEQIQHMYNDAIASQTPAAPKCPEHHQPMVKIVIPIGFKHAGQEVWICSHYTQCRQWQMDDDETLVQKSLSFIAEIGNGDLSKKMPYSPQRMAAMVKAAGIGRGTFYRRIAIQDGPPYCPDHKIEMHRLIIPQGYKNKGVKVWVCPQFDCEKWELADQK